MTMKYQKKVALPRRHNNPRPMTYTSQLLAKSLQDLVIQSKERKLSCGVEEYSFSSASIRKSIVPEPIEQFVNMVQGYQEKTENASFGKY